MSMNCEQCQAGLSTFMSLGVDQSLSVKSAYQMLVQVWHPDRFGHSHNLKTQAERNTKLLNSAYDHLRSHLDVSISVLQFLSSSEDKDQRSRDHSQAARPAEPKNDTKNSISELIMPFELDRQQALSAVEQFMISGEYTTEDFVLRAEMTKFSMIYLPAYIFSCEFDSQWTASFGFDHYEEYTHWERRYDADLKRHIKEPVTRTKLVTDWVVHSGSAPGYCSFRGYAGPAKFTYARRLVERSACDAHFHSFSPDFLRTTESFGFESSPAEVYLDSVECRVMDVISTEVKSYAQGDRQRDWRWTSNVGWDSQSLYMPACNAQLSYAGQVYDIWISGLNDGLRLGDGLPFDHEREKSVKRGFFPAKLTLILALGAVGYVCYKHFSNTTVDESLLSWPNALYLSWLALTVLSLFAFGSKRRKAVKRDSRERRERALAIRKAKQSSAVISEHDTGSGVSRSFQQRFWTRNDLDGILLPSLSLIAFTAVLLPLLTGILGASSINAHPAPPMQTSSVPVLNPPAKPSALIKAAPVSPDEEKVVDSSTAPPDDSGVSETTFAAQENAQETTSEPSQTVSEALTAWASAEESNNPVQQAECYSDQIDRFFLSRNVSKEYVRDYMTSWLQAHTRRVVSFTPRDVEVESESTSEVKVSLIKQVVTTDDQGTSERFTRSVLYLKKEGGKWKIFSERDFK